MNWKTSKDVNFQITVGQLALSSPLPKEDIRVTVCVGNLSKITCSGKQSKDGLTITWNHPFLFSASLSMSVEITIWILPDKLTTEWDKQQLGDKMVIDIANFLESSNEWQCHVHGLSSGQATLSMTCCVHHVLTVQDGHNCIWALMLYRDKLANFAYHFKNVPCISTCIEVVYTILDYSPLGSKNYTWALNSLGVFFQYRYRQDGNISDLNKAIEIEQTRLDLCSQDDPDHVEATGNLAIYLMHHYKFQKNKENLSNLMKIHQKWLDLCPSDHQDHSKALGGFAMSLLEQYNIERNGVDLNRSIELGQRMLDLCPEDDILHETAIRILAESTATRYQKQGDEADLNRAIDLREKHLQLCPPGHESHGHALQNLAMSLQDRYNKKKDHLDLFKKIKLLKEALGTYPVHHQYFAFNTAQLAATTLLLSTSSQRSYPSEVLPSMNEAFETYRQLKKCGPTASLHLWEATQAWVENAEIHSHPSVLEAYQTSLNSLDHFTSFNSSLDSRHEIMQATVINLANNAFSCATRKGNFQMAVEFLEQGRGIIWNQLAHFDISVAALETQGDQECELGRKFTQLSTDLRKQAQGSAHQDKGTDLYWRIRDEWQAVVDKIRCLDGFSQFLLPPRFDNLRHAAEHGPVIIVNASKYSCDALIVLCIRAPIHVPLPCSFADIDQLSVQLSELTQDAHAYGENRESWVKEMLRELWSSVVEPIASVLQNDIRLAPGSRIWWCPTSELTTLPLHAAGPYRKEQKNFPDLYVSSYAPSLSGLIRTRERVRAQTEARNVSGSGNEISFAAVGQARPGADTKLGELVEVEHEIRRIENETGMPPHVTFKAITRSAATVEGALQAFREHRWVHLACHGAQHATKPFDSWFAMGDGKLTLMRIIQERYTNSEFAFLSACHTAVGDASTPDEVLHLAAGMQFAGFNGVIGTLWRVDDAVAHRFVTRFYQEMFKYPDVDFEHAAAALNTAALATADEVSLEKRIVFVHIGI